MSTFPLIHPDQTITQTTLPDLLSQSSKTLLYFYPKNDTPGCTKEANDFTDRIQDFRDLGIQIVGVSRDTPESHCSFIAKYDLAPFYLSDPDLILHKQYGAYGEKNNYGKIVTGVIRSTILLDSDGTILQERHNVRATGHAERVLKAVS